MDHGYGVTSQVSGTTTCKISYIWAHQPLAEISVYGKTTQLQPSAWAWQTLARCGSSRGSSALASNPTRSQDKGLPCIARSGEQPRASDRACCCPTQAKPEG